MTIRRSGRRALEGKNRVLKTKARGKERDVRNRRLETKGSS